MDDADGSGSLSFDEQHAVFTISYPDLTPRQTPVRGYTYYSTPTLLTATLLDVDFEYKSTRSIPA